MEEIGLNGAILRWLDTLSPELKLRAHRALQTLFEIEMQAAIERGRK